LVSRLGFPKPSEERRPFTRLTSKNYNGVRQRKGLTWEGGKK
jgi:hypothetical protein